MSDFNCDTDFCKQCGLDGELCKGCVKKKCYEQGRADMLTEIKSKARKYHRGKDEPVEFVIYDNELEQLREQK